MLTQYPSFSKLEMDAHHDTMQNRFQADSKGELMPSREPRCLEFSNCISVQLITILLKPRPYQDNVRKLIRKVEAVC